MKFHSNKDFLENLQCDMFKFFFVTRPSLFCPKTSEQQLFVRNLGCDLHHYQYQMRCYRCIFKFPNIKIRENVPFVTLI